MSFRIVTPYDIPAPKTDFPNPDWQFPVSNKTLRAIQGSPVTQPQRSNSFADRPEPAIKLEPNDSTAFPYYLPLYPSYSRDLNTSGSTNHLDYHHSFRYFQDSNSTASPNTKQEDSTDNAIPSNLHAAADNSPSFPAAVLAVRQHQQPASPPLRRVHLVLLPPKRPTRLILTPPKKPKLRLLPPKRRVRLILNPPKPPRRSSRQHGKWGGRYGQ